MIFTAFESSFPQDSRTTNNFSKKIIFAERDLEATRSNEVRGIWVGIIGSVIGSKVGIIGSTISS